jgi:YYY domain-containing protein
LLGLLPRLYGLDWDANNHLHPDEREIVFKAMCLSLPGTPRVGDCDPAATGPGWFLSPNSPLNPHFFAYGSLPLYLLAGVVHGLAWLSHVTGGRFVSPRGGAWDDFDHFTLVGRALSAVFDAGSILLAGLIARRLGGRWAAVLAAALVATIPFDAQVAHFYAVDTLLLFFILLTLYACLRLIQVPRRAASGTQGEPPTARPAIGFWQPWRVGLFIGAAFGLAMATKVSALPLLAPIGVALVVCWRRRGLDDMLLAALGVASAAVLVFLLASPYTLIDWHTFQAQVNEQTQLSRGQLDYPYVRQFAGTTPFVYQIQQLLLYNMGLPLGLLGLAGFAWAAARLWRTLDDDWLILVVWTVGYFAVVGSAYMKFSRYMLPVFVPLAICGAAALAAFARWGTGKLREAHEQSPAPENAASASHMRSLRQPFATPLARSFTRIWGRGWWRIACIALGLTVLATSTAFTLALVNIYSAPNTRVRASEWIYNHVPLGATLTNEVWDDPLPIGVPPARTDSHGAQYTAAGHLIDPGFYNQVGLNLYDADTPDKAAQLAGQLAGADVVVISSQRLLKSIPKLPDRYPMTTRYYQLLFAGKLGFTLAAHFEDHPHLFGVTFDDNGADESYSVYDHPPVWIFTRSGAGLSQQELQALLTDGLTLPAASNRSGNQKSLLLSPDIQAANAKSPALGIQFPADSLPNRSPLIWWLLLVELLGVASFPLAFAVFPGLYDRGWGLAKLLGLLVLAWLVWLPASLKLLPFDRWVVVAAFAVLAASGAAFTWFRREQMWAFVRARWRVLALCEAAFLVAFLAFAWVRALDPDLWHIYRGGEKPMELAFLNAILHSRYLPPYDPWFSGGYINYYYYGQYLIAVLIKLTGVAPDTAFNLAVPLLFAVTFTGAFSVVAGLTRRAWVGLLAGFGLVVLGNLDGLRQVIVQWQQALAHHPIPPFDYWASSRVIPYTINEFPFWSFLYADLHAHLIDLPIVVLIIAGCGSLLADKQPDPLRLRPIIPTLFLLALALGAAWCTSTWDVPTYGVLIAAVLALRLLPFGRRGGWALLRAVRWWPSLRVYALALALVFGLTYALYLPFHANFQSFVSGTGPVTTPTDPVLFALLFGVWLFLLVSFFFVELRDRIARWLVDNELSSSRSLPGVHWILLGVSALVLLLAVIAGLKTLLILMLGIGLYLALDLRHSPLKLMTYALLLLGLAVALGVELVYVRDFLDNSPWERMNTVFKFYYQVWTFFALGGALAFSQLLSRVVATGASTPAVEWESGESGEPSDGATPSTIEGGVASDGSPAWGTSGVGRLLGRTTWGLALAALVAGSTIFVSLGTQARIQDPQVWAAVQPPPGGIQPQVPSLDGEAFMRGWYPSDFEAINWLNTHVSGAPTIVEASNGNYQWYGRVSIYTGLPSVLGWGSREYEQRYGDEVGPREGDVQNFWGTEDPSAARAFLHQYGVRYIYLGALERSCYMTQGDNNACVPMTPAAVAKFDTLEQEGILRMAHRNTDVVIYEVTGA